LARHLHPAGLQRWQEGGRRRTPSKGMDQLFEVEGSVFSIKNQKFSSFFENFSSFF
jgi:hypothetical protein